jgi:hypothetical protein
VLRGAQVPAAPIRNRRAGNGKLRLQARQQEDRSNRDHQHCRDVAEDANIEADRIADGRDKEPDDYERDRKTTSKGSWSQTMFRSAQ